MFGLMPNGELRQANLKMLFQKAKQYESSNFKGLYNFINFIDRLKLSSGDLGSAKLIGENDNVIRIMSIHKSKGLEFPVVFLSSTGKQFNLMDLNDSVLLHQEMGIGVKYIDYDKQIQYDTLSKASLRSKMLIETLSEEMRILYVALTRSKEKLIITGIKNDYQKDFLKMSEQVERYIKKDGKINTKTNNEVGTVEFKNVSFKYPDADEYLLKDISFKANKGDTVAFIGSTGSGKSTLINLIPRFYDATEGEVLVDGINVKNYTQEFLHDKIGYVPQKAVMFNGTVKSNISYGDNGKEKPTDEQIKKAIEVAQGTEFVEKMDGQYDAHMAQGGTNVSGGQKQRLSIARAIARNPEIYIFDDSFSALDYKTDSVLRKELKKYTSDATSLIVAQRIGTIMNADQIVVLDNGVIVGKGTHKELLKTCEVYKQIALSQLSKEELENG